ncbi:MAG: hypothetical protein ACJAXX_002986, partial [Roseivirga sp.]
MFLRLSIFLAILVLPICLLSQDRQTWIFILAGQSNMAGRGILEDVDTVTNSRVFSIDIQNSIVQASEPLHFYEPTKTGLDCGMSFALTMIEELYDGIDILLLPTAVGGSSVLQWLNDSTHQGVKLFTNFREKVNLGKSIGEFKGILWHQGENDANTEGIQNYSKRLKALFAKFREETGVNDLPILAGELGSFSRKPDEWDQINTIIHKVASEDDNTFVINTQDLDHKGDRLHFNSKGLRTLGQRYSEQILEIYNLVFTTSGAVTVDEDFAATQTVSITAGIVPTDEVSQTVTYSISP